MATNSRILDLLLRIRSEVDAGRDITALQGEIDALVDSASQGIADPTTELRAGADRATQDVGALNNALGDSGRQAQSAGDEQGRLSKGMLGLTDVVKGFIGLELASQFLDFANRSKALQKELEAQTGSTAAAKAEMEALREIADRNGLTLDNVLTPAYQRLVAATNGTALAGAATKTIIDDLAAAYIKANGPADEFTDALEPITEMLSEGTINMEEFMESISEDFPPAMQAAATATIENDEALRQMLGTGDAIADEFLPRFAQKLREHMGAGKEPVSGMSAEWARLQNQLVASAGAIDSVIPVSDLLAGALAGVTGALKVTGAGLSTVGQTFDLVRDGLGALGTSLATGTSLTDGLGEAWQEYEKDLNAGVNAALGVKSSQDDLNASVDEGTLAQKRMQEALKNIEDQYKKTGNAVEETTALFDSVVRSVNQSFDTANVLQLATATQEVGKMAGFSSDEVNALDASIGKLSNEALAELQQEARAAMDSVSAGNQDAMKNIMGLGEVLDSVARVAFQRLGLDGTEAMTGLDDATQKQIESLGLLADTGKATGDTLRTAIGGILEGATTVTELTALEAQVKAIGEAGKLSATDVDYLSVQISQRATEMTAALNPTIEALGKFGIDGREALTGLDTDFQGLLGTLQVLQDDAAVIQEVLFRAFDQAAGIASTKQETDILGQAIKDAGDNGKLSLEQVKSLLTDLKVKTTELKDETDLVDKAYDTLGVDSAASLKALADQASLAFNTLKGGGATTGELNAAFESMADKVLAAADAQGPLALAVAEGQLKARAATDEQRQALADLILQYDESAAAAEKAAQEQVAATDQVTESLYEQELAARNASAGATEYVGALAGVQAAYAEINGVAATAFDTVGIAAYQSVVGEIESALGRVDPLLSAIASATGELATEAGRVSLQALLAQADSLSGTLGTVKGSLEGAAQAAQQSLAGAIAAAKAEMAAFAADEKAALADRLKGIQDYKAEGDKLRQEELRHEREIADLQDKLALARQQGNKDAVVAIQDQIAAENQLHTLKMGDLQAEIAAIKSQEIEALNLSGKLSEAEKLAAALRGGASQITMQGAVSQAEKLAAELGRAQGYMDETAQAAADELLGAIEDAKAAMQAFADQQKTALADRLKGIQDYKAGGDKLRQEELRHERELIDLQDLLKIAKSQNNQDAIKAITEQIAAESELHTLKMADLVEQKKATQEIKDISQKQEAATTAQSALENLNEISFDQLLDNLKPVEDALVRIRDLAQAVTAEADKI